MNHSEPSQDHPFRVFETHPDGGFPASELSALLARPGVGKTAALINFALDHMFHDRKVLHFSLGLNSDKVHQFYRRSIPFLPKNWGMLMPTRRGMT